MGGGGGNRHGEEKRKFRSFQSHEASLLLYAHSSSQVSSIHELLMPFTFNPAKMLAGTLKEH